MACFVLGDDGLQVRKQWDSGLHILSTGSIHAASMDGSPKSIIRKAFWGPIAIINGSVCGPCGVWSVTYKVGNRSPWLDKPAQRTQQGALFCGPKGPQYLHGGYLPKPA